jgi:hypothetical protein
MKVSNNFKLEEFVSKEVYDQFKDNSLWFVNPLLIKTVQDIRDNIGKGIFINNWNTGGSFHNCGYRAPNSIVGAKFSQHKLGNAADLHVVGMDNAEFWKYIKDNRNKLFSCITAMEDIKCTAGWVHIDLRNTGGKFIIVQG